MPRRIFILFCLVLLSCTSPASQTIEPQQQLKTSFYLYRFDPPAFIEYSEDFQLVKETSFAIPPNCGLFNTFPAPVGKFMLIELNCPNGQTVLFMDVKSTSVTQPVTDTDSHFLAWALDGTAAYLKIDSLGQPRVIRAFPDGKQEMLPINEYTYDLAPSGNQDEFTFTFSRGMGQGSELWLAKRDGDSVEKLYADPLNYISFARWSPDGSQIAFIKIPDSQVPFTVGELWVIPSTFDQGADGSTARKLADADAGHGYAANWSPDGRRIAFVVRENPDQENANQSVESLISNIYLVDVESGEVTQVTHLTDGHVETPSWSPNGNLLAFNEVINGRIDVRIAEITTGEIRSLIPELTCCPAWMRK